MENLTLLQKTHQKSDSCYYTSNDGTKIYHYENISIFIIKDNRDIVYHIERHFNKPGGIVTRYSKNLNAPYYMNRSKLYDTVEEFDKAIIRIEKIVNNSNGNK